MEITVHNVPDFPRWTRDPVPAPRAQQGAAYKPVKDFLCPVGGGAVHSVLPVMSGTKATVAMPAFGRGGLLAVELEGAGPRSGVEASRWLAYE